jgi:hypothetical protein
MEVGPIIHEKRTGKDSMTDYGHDLLFGAMWFGAVEER